MITEPTLYTHFQINNNQANSIYPNFINLLKISINNHPLLYIHINTHKYT